MPAIITHYTCAKKALASYPLTYEQAFEVGSQGPDPFFFYGQLPWKKREGKEKVDALGRTLHHVDIAPIYSVALHLAYQSEDKDVLFDYLSGAFLHYLLDKNCHPYIFPKAGFASDPTDKEGKKKYAILHCLFETYIDVLLGKKEGTFSNRCYRYLNVPSKQLKAISHLWREVNDATLKLPGIDDRSFYDGVKDYAGIEHFVNVHPGLKRKLIRKLMGEMSLPFAMNFPKKIPANHAALDFLNSEKTPWPDDCSGVKHSDSFEELFARALAQYAELVPYLEKAKQGEDILPYLSKMTGGINHDGTHEGEAKVFSDPIWPRE